MSAVLFLDHTMLPLRIESWERALTDLFLGKVEVIEWSADKSIQGVDRVYPLPSVVRLLRHFKRDRVRVKFSRINIYARDRFTCQYCGLKGQSQDMNLDHVIPRGQGGKTCWENVVCACIKCNTKKGCRTPAQAGLTLRSTPKKPKHLPMMSVHINMANVPEEWKYYWTTGIE